MTDRAIRTYRFVGTHGDLVQTEVPDGNPEDLAIRLFRFYEVGRDVLYRGFEAFDPHLSLTRARPPVFRLGLEPVQPIVGVAPRPQFRRRVFKYLGNIAIRAGAKPHGGRPVQFSRQFLEKSHDVTLPRTGKETPESRVRFPRPASG
ncbi:MAG TPA: hypothetical protein VGM57_16625 [Pseudolabrys sp.]